MRVLVVLARQGRMASYHLPLGIGYVSASLKRAGHDVAVLNPNHSTEDLEPLVARAIMEHQPQVLAIGGMAFHMLQIRQMVAAARPLLPHSPIVLGGSLVTNQPEVAMTALPEVDIGVVGEGEATAVELLAALSSGGDLDAVKGLVYRTPGTGALKRTAPRPIEENLDSLPWVDYEGLGLDVYAGLHGPGEMAPGLIVAPGARVLPFLTSRGCPYPCTFCCHAAAGRRYRLRSLDDVFAELEAAIGRFGINTVCIFDDLFCLKHQRLEDFCQRVRPLGLRWECSMRVEQVSRENLRMMRDSGCAVVSVGVESMSPTVLDSMQKKTTREALDRALADLYDEKMTTWSNLIFGDPAETMETATDSLEWWVKNNRYDLRTAFIGYYPGAKIYDDAVRNGLIADPVAYLQAGNPEINATAMSDDEFARLKGKVNFYIVVFGVPGKITEMRQDECGNIAISAICPHCGHDNCYEDVRLMRGIIIRISCNSCGQLFRFPIILRKAVSDELGILLSKVSGVDISLENMSFISAIFLKIVSMDSSYIEIWNALIRCADLAGNTERAFDYLTAALLHNPYYPDLFEQMDARLARFGFDAERVKYARQAALLRRVGITAPTYVTCS